MTRNEIEAVGTGVKGQRIGVYVMTNEKREAIAEARATRLVSDDEATQFWKS